MNVGTLKLDLLLDRTQFDRTLKEAERDAKLFENTKFVITPQVDHKPLAELNRHFDLKQKHHDSINRHFKSNPLKPRVDMSELEKLQGFKAGMTIGGTIGAEASSSNNSTKLLERSLSENLSSIQVLLEKIAENTKPKGIVGRALDTVAQGIGFSVGFNASAYLGGKVKSSVESRVGSLELLDKKITEKFKADLSNELENFPLGIKETLNILNKKLQKKIDDFLGEFNISVELNSRLKTQQDNSSKKYGSAVEGNRTNVQNLVRERFDLIDEFSSLKQESNTIEKKVNRIIEVLSNESLNLEENEIEAYAKALNDFDERQSEVNKSLRKKRQEIEKNTQDLARARQEAVLLKSESPNQNYLDLIRDLNKGRLPSQKKIPKLVVDDETLKDKGAEALYYPESNVIAVRSELKKALDEGTVTAEMISTLLHEIQHAIDFDFGSSAGIEARNKGQITSVPLIPTAEEIKSLMSLISRYPQSERVIEMNAELASSRQTPKSYERIQRQRQTDELFDLVGFAGADFSNYAAEYKTKFESISKQVATIEEAANDVGVTYSHIIKNITGTISNLEAKFALLEVALINVATGSVDKAGIESAQREVVAQIKSITSFLATFGEFKKTAVEEINQIKNGSGGDATTNSELVARPKPAQKLDPPALDIPEDNRELVTISTTEGLAQRTEGAIQPSALEPLSSVERAGELLRKAAQDAVELFSKGAIKGTAGFYNYLKEVEDDKLEAWGKRGKRAIQTVGLGVAATHAPGIHEAVGLINEAAKVGANAEAHALAQTLVDQLASNLPGVFKDAVQNLSDLGFMGIGDMVSAIRDAPEKFIDSLLTSLSNKVSHDAMLTGEIIAGGTGSKAVIDTVLDAVQRHADPDFDEAKGRQDLLQSQRSLQKADFVVNGDPEVLAAKETQKNADADLEMRIMKLSDTAEATANKLRDLFTIEGLRRLAPMVGIPTTTMSGDKPIKSGTIKRAKRGGLGGSPHEPSLQEPGDEGKEDKEDIADTITRIASKEDIDRAISLASPEMFRAKYKDMGKIKPEVDKDAFVNLQRYWKEEIEKIKSIEIGDLNAESAIDSLKEQSIGYVNLLNNKELTGSQRQSAGNIHGQSVELQNALEAYSKFQDLGGLVDKLNERFGHGASKVDKHWGDTAESILKNFRILSAEAKVKGYDLQRFMSQGSPGPTQKIKQHWGDTEGSVKGNLNTLASEAEKAGRKIEDSITFDAQGSDSPKVFQELASLLNIDREKIPTLDALPEDAGFLGQYDIPQNKISFPQNEMNALKQASSLVELDPNLLQTLVHEFIHGIQFDFGSKQTDGVVFDNSALLNRLKERQLSDLSNFTGTYSFEDLPSEVHAEGYAKLINRLIQSRGSTEDFSSLIEELYRTISDGTPSEESITPYVDSSEYLSKMRRSIFDLDSQFESEPQEKQDEVGDVIYRAYDSIRQRLEGAQALDAVDPTASQKIRDYYQSEVDALGDFLKGKDKNTAFSALKYFAKIHEVEDYNQRDFFNSDPDFAQTYTSKRSDDSVSKVNFASANPLKELEERFNIPADKAQHHWAETATEILQQIDRLATEAKDKGYDIQRAISEGSPGTTQRIREHWDTTAKAVAKNLDYIKRQAQTSGTDINKAFNDDSNLKNSLKDAEFLLKNFQNTVAEIDSSKIDLNFDDSEVVAANNSLKATSLFLDNLYKGRFDEGFDTQSVGVGFDQLTGKFPLEDIVKLRNKETALKNELGYQDRNTYSAEDLDLTDDKVQDYFEDIEPTYNYAKAILPKPEENDVPTTGDTQPIDWILPSTFSEQPLEDENWENIKAKFASFLTEENLVGDIGAGFQHLIKIGQNLKEVANNGLSKFSTALNSVTENPLSSAIQSLPSLDFSEQINAIQERVQSTRERVGDFINSASAALSSGGGGSSPPKPPRSTSTPDSPEPNEGRRAGRTLSRPSLPSEDDGTKHRNAPSAVAEQRSDATRRAEGRGEELRSETTNQQRPQVDLNPLPSFDGLGNRIAQLKQSLIQYVRNAADAISNVVRVNINSGEPIDLSEQINALQERVQSTRERVGDLINSASAALSSGGGGSSPPKPPRSTSTPDSPEPDDESNKITQGFKERISQIKQEAQEAAKAIASFFRGNSEDVGNTPSRVRKSWSTTTRELTERFKRIREQAQISGSAIEQMFQSNPSAMQSLEAMEDSVNRLKQALANGGESIKALFEDGLLTEDDIANSLKAIMTNVGDIELGQTLTFDTTEAIEGLSLLGDAISDRDIEEIVSRANRSLASFREAYRETVNSLSEDPLSLLGNLYEDYASVIEGLPNMSDIFSGVSGFIEEMSEASPIFANIVGFVEDLGVSVLALLGFEEFSDVILSIGQSFIEAGREFQRFDRAMVAAGKSGQDVFDGLYDRSQEFGTSLKESMLGYTQLSLGVQGTANEGLVDTVFPSFQKAFASRQSTPDQQSRGFLAIEQMISKGNASAEELRQQLSEALPGAFAVAAQSMGMDMQEFTERLYAAQIASDELLTKMGAFYEVDSQILLEISSKSFEADLARVTNAIDKIMIGGSQIVIPILAPGLQAAATILSVLAENIEFVAFILGGVFLKAIATVLASLWNVVAVTKINTLMVKTMGFEYAMLAAKLSSPFATITMGMNMVTAAARAMWTAFAMPTAIIGGFYVAYKLLTANVKEMEAAAKIGRRLNQESKNIDKQIQKDKEKQEKKEKEEQEKKDKKEKRDPEGFWGSRIEAFGQRAGGSDKNLWSIYKTLITGSSGNPFSQLGQRRAFERLPKSIEKSQDTNAGIQKRVMNTDFLAIKPKLDEIEEKLVIVSSKRSVAVGNSDFGQLVELDQQRETLQEQSKKLLEPVMRELSLAKKEQEKLKTEEEKLAKDISLGFGKESEYDERTNKIKHEITVNQGIINSLEQILEALATTISADFANFAQVLDNTRWAIDGAYKLSTISDLEDKLRGNITSLELETRGVTRDVVRAQEDSAALQHLVDRQRARINSENHSLQQAALVKLELDTDVPFEKQLNKILDMSPEFLEGAAKDMEGGTPGVGQFLLSLAELSRTADEAVTASQNVLEAEQERASKLKETAASYRDFSNTLRDFYRSLEDIQIERQRFAEDFPEEVADVYRSVNRSARDLTERYEDFIRSLDKSILQTQLEVAQLDKQIKNTKLRNKARSFFAPGSQGFGTDLTNLYLDYLESLESEEEIGLQKNIKRLDTEDQILQFSRQIRDLSEERENFERDRLQQLLGLLRQQEDYNLQQKRTWEDTLEKWYEIESEAKSLGISLGITSNDVATEGTNLVSAIATLSSKILEISDRLAAESKNRIAPPKVEEKIPKAEESKYSVAPYSESQLKSLREPPAERKPTLRERIKDNATDVKELILGKPTNAATPPDGKQYIDTAPFEQLQRDVDAKKRKSRSKPAPIVEYQPPELKDIIPEPVQKVGDYLFNTPDAKALDTLTDHTPVIKDIKQPIVEKVQDFRKDPIGTITDIKNDALTKFGDTPFYDGLEELNGAIEAGKEKARGAAKAVDDYVEGIPVLGDIYKGGKQGVRNLWNNKWNPFNRSDASEGRWQKADGRSGENLNPLPSALEPLPSKAQALLNFAWGNENSQANQYASMGGFYSEGRGQRAEGRSLAQLPVPVAAPIPVDIIKKEDIKKLEEQERSRRNQNPLPSAIELLPSIDYSEKEAEVKQKSETYYELLSQKYEKDIELLGLSNAAKKRNYVDDAARKVEEIDRFVLEQNRNTSNQEYDLEKQSKNAKNYLTIPEQVDFAGRDVGQEYQNQINSLDDEISSLTKLFINFKATVVTWSEEEYKDDPEAQKLVETAQQGAISVSNLLNQKERQKANLEGSRGEAVGVASRDRSIELDFQRQDEELGVRSEILQVKRDRTPGLIHGFGLNKEARDIGTAEIEVNFDKQLKQFDYLKESATTTGKVYDDMKKRLEQLRDVSLAKLAQETSSLAQVFDEVAQPALNGLLDDFIDTSVRASEAWSNFAKSILLSLAEILMSYAKNEFFKMIFGGEGAGVDISQKQEQKGGLDWGDALQLGAGAVSGLSKSKPKQGEGSASEPQASGFNWGNTIASAASFIPLFFSQGGDTEAMVIPYASQGADTEAMVIPYASKGLDTSDLALAKGLNEAIRKEAHPQAFPAVLHKGEVVLSDLNGDAQLLRELRSSGEWNQLKTEGYQQTKVDNFRYGSEGTAVTRSGTATVINNYSSVNVTAKNADSFKRTEDQIYRRQRLMQERSKR